MAPNASFAVDLSAFAATSIDVGADKNTAIERHSLGHNPVIDNTSNDFGLPVADRPDGTDFGKTKVDKTEAGPRMAETVALATWQPEDASRRIAGGA